MTARGRSLGPPPKAEGRTATRGARRSTRPRGRGQVGRTVLAVRQGRRRAHRGSRTTARGRGGRSAPPCRSMALAQKACEDHGYYVAVVLPPPQLSEQEQRRATELVREHYDKSASGYNRQIAFFERILFGEGRSWVCSQAEGEVLEIAVGTGRNLRYYSDDVRLTGIELSPEMLDIARREAANIGREADLRVGDAEALEFEDESFDTVTCTLALCTIPDDRAAVGEMWRVLRPGGRLLLLEHVRSHVRPVRIGQRALEPLMLRFEQDHLLREPLEHVRPVGFSVERVERSKAGIVERLAARKPAGASG